MYRVINETRVPIKIWANDLEDLALSQAINVTKVPNVVNHVALMADCHAGKGSTIGSVINLSSAMIPSTVGVDIGCGMIALRLPFKIERIVDRKSSDGQSLAQLRHSFERSIPLGRDSNRVVSDSIANLFRSLGLPRIFTQENKEMRNAVRQLGSLSVVRIGAC